MKEEQSPAPKTESKEKPAVERLATTLKERRLKLGLTIERVAMATKISLPFIKALEEEDLQNLPEPVFSRGFIRNICKMYDLSDKELLSLFEEALNSKDKTQENDEEPSRRSRSSRHLRKQVQRYGSKKALNFGILKPVPFTVLAAGVLVGVALSYYFITRNKVQVASKIQQQTPPIAAISSQSPKSELTVPPPVPQGVKEEIDNLDLKVEELTATEDGQIVEILVKEPVKVKIAKDGGEWVSETLNPDSYQYRFQEQLNLHVYNAEAVEVSYNGQKLGKLGAKGDLKKLSFRLKEGPAL